ncbi:predicted acyltransferase [Chthonomonas calidirosea]|uniref:acyltransferase family protein n=1 Tax=Chthonomonas calidirosea TaxID=454171 RepID=UPI0006972460|nr:acyltransferase family protein [Chthonomonas calidirosea]CEK16500.1 predicted acyltransferase [Chthonomonas calidirosea]
MSSSYKPRVRIEYLDGLRGVAALFVVMHHTFLTFFLSPVALRTHLPPLLLTLWNGLLHFLFAFGHEAVVVFIVLSGYVLMLPVTRTPNGTLPNGIADYVKRRARRILPPYYAALAFSLLIIFCIPGMNQKSQAFWDAAIPIDNWKTIIAHLFLVHNHHGWAYQIDPPKA